MYRFRAMSLGLALFLLPTAVMASPVVAPEIPTIRGTEAQYQQSKFSSADAKKAMKRRKWKKMLSHAESAWRAYKSPTYAVLQAIAHTRLKAPKLAFEWLVIAKSMNPPSALLETIDEYLKKVAAKLRPRMGLAQLRVPEGAAVSIDGVKVRAGLVGLSYGDHAIAVTQGGYEPASRSLSIASMGPTVATFELKKLVKVTPKKVVVAVPQPKTTATAVRSGTHEDDSGLSVPGWTLVGVGGALAIAGGVLAALATSDRDALDVRSPEYSTEFEAAEMRRGVGLGGVGLGAAALITGVILVVLDGSTDDDDPGKQVGFAPLPGGGLVGLGGKW